MYATEFQTVINEPYIQVPNYETPKGHEVRIVFLDLQIEEKIDKLTNLLANKKADIKPLKQEKEIFLYLLMM